ncbi:MAG: hypothetical protein ACI8PQ_003084, partial [Planctomycetota bacterium]
CLCRDFRTDPVSPNNCDGVLRHDVSVSVSGVNESAELATSLDIGRH